MLLLTLRETMMPPPAAAIAISPWTDPANTGASMTTNRAFDWMSQALGNQLALWAGPDFIATGNLADWRSDRDLADLPPLLVHAGEAEICRSMIEQFCARAAASGAPITCVIWPDMNHNFHGFGDLMPQSQQALDAISAFVARHVR
jgi:acetyl esterase/lipase